MEPKQVGLIIGLIFFLAVAYVGFKCTETKGKGGETKGKSDSSSSEKKE